MKTAILLAVGLALIILFHHLFAPPASAAPKTPDSVETSDPASAVVQPFLPPNAPQTIPPPQPEGSSSYPPVVYPPIACWCQSVSQKEAARLEPNIALLFVSIVFFGIFRFRGRQ